MRAEEPGRDRDEDRAELEFDSERAIPFGETIVLERRFPRAFRAVALAIPRELGLAFEVVDVRIGPRSQLRGGRRSVAAHAFSGPETDGLLGFDVCQPNQAISVEVRNADPERRSWSFRARVIGAVV